MIPPSYILIIVKNSTSDYLFFLKIINISHTFHSCKPLHKTWTKWTMNAKIIVCRGLSVFIRLPRYMYKQYTPIYQNNHNLWQ